MMRRPHPLEPLEHRAADVLLHASGRMLALWPVDAVPRVFSAAVESVDHVDATDVAALEKARGHFDTVASIGQLGVSADIAALVGAVVGLLSPTSVLLFCEPTVAGGLETPGPPNDVTGALWAGGLTVFDCRRFRARHRLRTFEYCWGRARLTPIRSTL